MYRQSEKNLLSSNTSSTCPRNMVNFGPLAAEIVLLVWGTPANFNGFRVLVALLHDTPVVGVSQTLRHWTEGASCIRQGGHHVGHWPTFLVVHYFTNDEHLLFAKSSMTSSAVVEFCYRTFSYDVCHMTAFQPVSEAQCSWSYDKGYDAAN